MAKELYMKMSELSSPELSNEKNLRERALISLTRGYIATLLSISQKLRKLSKFGNKLISPEKLRDERGDVPGWVLVVLMTTGLVTAIWTIAAPRLTAILRNSLDSINGIR